MRSGTLLSAALGLLLTCCVAPAHGAPASPPQVVAAAEPGDLAAMAARWPDAAHVFLDTDFNPRGAVREPPASARWVGDYSGDLAPPVAAPASPAPPAR